MNSLISSFEEGIDVLNADKTAAAFNTQETVDLLNKYKEYTDKRGHS